MFRFPCERISLNQARRECVSRRAFLHRWGMGVGSVAASMMLSQNSSAGERSQDEGALAIEGQGGILERLHLPARAKSVIYLYMDGGPGQMDTFDPKPELSKRNGKPFPMKKEPTQFDNNGLS